MSEKAPLLLRRLPEVAVRGLCSAFWGLRFSGRELIPAAGPVIVAANHSTLLDGPMIVMAVGPARFVRFLGKAELFEVPVLGWYLRRIGMLPLERRGDVAAMLSALQLLRKGGCLGLFPQGSRTKPGQPPLPARAGLGFLAGQTGAAVVPARIVGVEAFPWTRGLEVRFGAPLVFEGDSRDREQCLEFGRRVMERVFAL